MNRIEKVFFVALVGVTFGLFFTGLIAITPNFLSTAQEFRWVVIFLLCGSVFFGAVLYKLLSSTIVIEGPPVIEAQTITLSGLGELVASLDPMNDGAFVVVMFSDNTNKFPEGLNIQYSIENGRLGLDWVLVASGNIELVAGFKEFVSKSGYTVKEFDDYLRVEGENLVDLGKSILQDHGVKPNDKLDIVES